MSPSAINDLDTDAGQETIAQLSPPVHETSSIDPLINLLTLAYKATTPFPKTQHRLLTLMNTISTSQPGGKIYSHEEELNSFIRYISPALNGMAGLQDFEKAVSEEATEDPEGFREFWQLGERNLLGEMVEGMGGASPGGDVVFLDTFVGGKGFRVALGSEGTLFRVGEGVKIGETMRLVKHEEVDGRLSFYAVD